MTSGIKNPSWDEAESSGWRGLIGSGKLDEALLALGQHLESSPRDAAALHDLSVVLARKKQFKEAAEKFALAVEAEPGRHSDRRDD